MAPVPRADFIENWDSLMQSLTGGLPDIYFSEKYHALFRDQSSQALCFCFISGKEYFLLPLIKSPIPDNPAVYDAQSAYGYGGALSSSQDRQFLSEAFDEFLSQSRHQGICAAFIRNHPILCNHELLPDALTYRERSTVGITLTDRNESQIVSAMSKSSQAEILEAKSKGIKITFDDSRKALEEFSEIYQLTMLRLNAADFYLFSADHFRAIISELSGRVTIASARLEGITIASAMILEHPHYGHYHLSASILHPLRGHANKLLIFESALRLRSTGKRIFHLGGGTTSSEDDSLLSFKRRLSDAKFDFYCSKIIVDNTAYQAAVQAWQQKLTVEQNKFCNYFLCYRY